MAAGALIDTGAILALLDRSDRWHWACVEAYNNTAVPLLTTEAVLAEVFHLTYRNLRDVTGVWRLLRSGAIRMSSISHEELPRIEALMDRKGAEPGPAADWMITSVRRLATQADAILAYEGMACDRGLARYWRRPQARRQGG